MKNTSSAIANLVRRESLRFKRVLFVPLEHSSAASMVFLCTALLFALAILHTRCGRPATAAVHFDPGAVPYPRLSEYRFFTDLPRQIPNERVLPYELITPLFTDYAHKARFVWMPAGVNATVGEAGELVFPNHTVLIKTFYYPADYSAPEKDWDGVETRLLIKRQGDWEAYTYVWDENQSDARLTRVGAFREVSWIDPAGRAQRIEYVAPNQNQCKSCHNRNNRIEPIGPKVRNLDKAVRYPDGLTANQLDRWQSQGLLAAGDWPDAFPALADWTDTAAYDLNQRALAYLDVNCGHCHRPDGPAHTTGLYLTYDQTEPTRLGICKPPVAAGKGSGGRRFGIAPGKPDASILVYRMESNDPGVMMPELGRVIPHREGIDLIREWIAGLEGGCP